MKMKCLLSVVAALSSPFTAVFPASAQNWTLTSAPTDSWRALASSADGTKLVAVASGGLVYTSPDSGTNWYAKNAPSAAWNTVASSWDGAKLVAAVYGGLIYSSADSGVTWTPTGSPSARWSSVASSLDGSKLVAAINNDSTGSNNALYVSANSGVTWTRTTAPAQHWNGVASSADGSKLVAVAGNAAYSTAGPIFTSADSGVTWQPSGAPSNVWNTVASSADGTKLVAAGQAIGVRQSCRINYGAPPICTWVPATFAGPIYTSTNSGATWMAATNAPHENWDSVTASADGSRLAAAAAADDLSNLVPLYTSTNSGITWMLANSPANKWSSVASSADGTKLAAAVQGGQIYTWNTTNLNLITNLFLITQPASQTILGGISVTLYVIASGAAPLSYQWEKNGTNFLISATNAVLTFTNLALSDSGSYAVLVTNHFNTVWSSNAVLTVLPSVVVTLPTTGASYNQATFNGTVASGLDPTFAWFQWGTDTNYGQATPAMAVTNALTPVSFNNSVTGLAPGVYHCQAVASNVLGVVLGADVAFDTRTNPPTLAFTIASPSSSSLSGVAVDSAGNIYVADGYNLQVLKFAKNGAYVTQWFSGSGYQNYNGMGVAVDSVNSVYVSDPYGQIIRRYNASGFYITAWGSPGSGNGQFNGLDYIAAGTSVYASDSGNYRVEKFSTFGGYQAQWGSQGTNNGQFNYGAAGVALDGSNNLYVTDPYNYRVQKFSGSGAYLTQWGSYGSGPGQFSYPGSVAADASNTVYVLDYYNGVYSRIEKFAGDGSFLTQWFLPSNGNYQNLAVDRHGNFIYVTDSGYNRILVYVNDVSIVAPLIINQPLSRTVTAGASVTFSATAFGGNPLAYQWQAHSTNLTSATNPSVTLSAVGLADAGAYRVVVTNSAGQIASTVVSLNVVAGFATTQPANGISVTSATLNGMATVNLDNTTAWFQWGTSAAYGNVAGGSSVPASGNVTAVAAPVNGLVNDYIYHFRLVVSNSFGMAYGADQQFATGRKVFLSGGYPDPTTASLSNIVAIAAGYTLGFGIRNDGTVASWGTPYTYGTSFPTGLSNIVAISVGEAQTTALKSDGTAIFWGVATSGTATLPGLTNLVAVSSELALKSDGSVVEWNGGTNATAIPGWTNIVAIAEGYLDTIALKNDGTVINRFGSTPIPSGLNNVVAISTGGYYGGGQSYLALKNDGTIVCWGFESGIPGGLNNVEAISCYNFKTALTKGGFVRSWYLTSFYPDVPAALGNVVAIASWQGGTVVLASQTYPASITLAATQIITNGVTLNASINPNGANTTAWFLWGTNTTYGQMTPTTPLGNTASPTSFSNNLSGLTPNTTYHCQVVASNFLGVVAGSDVTFATAGPPFATTSAAIPVTSTDTEINGLVTPNQLSTTAWFEWGTNTSYGNTTAITNITGGNMPMPIGNLLSGLDSSIVWHFRVVASNSVGVATGADHVFGGLHYGYAATVLADQPLIYYRFEETNGLTAFNSGTLGSAGDGTYNTNDTLGNPSLSDLFGSAAGFNGVNTGVAVPASATQNQFTIEAWVRLGSFPNPAEVYAQDAYANGAWALQMNGPQMDLVILGNSPQEITFGDQTMLFAGQWTQVAATYDSGTKTMVGYINGLPVATNHYSTAWPALWASAHLGRFVGTYFLNGLMDEFALYDRALPADRILAHYKAAATAPGPGVFARSPAPALNWTSVAASADGTKLVAVAGAPSGYSAIYVSTNSGATWWPTAAPVTHWNCVASSADGVKLAAAVYGGYLYTSSDSGKTWIQTTAPSAQWGSIASSADGTRLAAAVYDNGSGNNGPIYTSTDSGTNWFKTSAPNKLWNGIASSADGTKLVAVASDPFDNIQGSIYHSTNSGSVWMQSAAPVAYWMSVASSADGRQLVAAAYNLPIYQSSDSGASWTPTTAPATNWWFVASSADGARLIAAAGGALGSGPVFTSADSGATWTPGNAPLIKWSAIASSADGGQVVAVVYGGGIYTSRTAPAPLLRLMPSGGNAFLSWIIPSLDFTLQQNSDLTTTNWTDVPTPPVLNLTNLQNQVMVSPTNGHTFYRLKH
jgi:hypothetical protein